MLLIFLLVLCFFLFAESRNKLVAAMYWKLGVFRNYNVMNALMELTNLAKDSRNSGSVFSAELGKTTV